MERFSIIDTHTGGEPTRVVFAADSKCLRAPFEYPPGGESTSNGAMVSLSWLRDQADFIRSALLSEPRGCESMVGAWVAPASDARHTASVVFFNNAGYLGMCGHGLIGVVEAMRYRNAISAGVHVFETPAGVVTAKLQDDNSVSFENVRSFRYRKDVVLEIDSPKTDGVRRRIVGDIAYGGNWFFLVDVDQVHHTKIGELTALCVQIRAGLKREKIFGADGAEIDHIELSAALGVGSDHSSLDTLRGRNFVLCPGGHYDRSPCGTGTSAKVACMAEDRSLEPQQLWIQESVVGSRFTASYRVDEAGYRVRIQGRAFVTAEMTCLLDPDDPYRDGICLATGHVVNA